MIKCKMVISSTVLLGIFILSGCATTVKVNSINSNVGTIIDSDTLPQKIKIAVNEFEIKSDKLKNNVIGIAKTGMFNINADIISEEPPVSVFRKAISNGFQKNGFTIVESDVSDYIVSGTIEKFWVEEYATGFSLEYSKGFVRYDIIVKNHSGQVVYASTKESYQTSNKSVDTTFNNIPTLEKALTESINTVFLDNSFINALN